MAKKRTKKVKHICAHCGQKASLCATVWTRPLNDKNAPLSEAVGYLCRSCVTRWKRREQISLGIYAVLQICWVSFINGGISVLGIMGAVVAGWSLTRLVRGLSGLIWTKVKPDQTAPSWMEVPLSTLEAASSLLKEVMKEEARERAIEVFDLRQKTAQNLQAPGQAVSA